MERKNSRGWRIYRTEQILDMLEKGVGSVEVGRRMQENEKRWEEAEKRGRKAEVRVMEALEKLPWVVGVQRYEPYSRQDRKGRDLYVALREKMLPHVYVQVKASEGGVIAFKEELEGKLWSWGVEMSVEQWLRKKRIIVLVGMQSEEKIQKEFEEMVDKWCEQVGWRK